MRIAPENSPKTARKQKNTKLEMDAMIRGFLY